MNETLESLIQFGFRLCRQTLAGDSAYLEVCRERDAQQKSFRETHPDDVWTEACTLVDAELAPAAIMTDTAFLLGLQLGAAIGGLRLIES